MRIRYSSLPDGKPVKKAVVYTRDEHGIKLADVDREAVQIVERLGANGHETYIVGGAVRDLILGKKPKDFDIVSDASPTRIKKLFRNARIIGHRFRLVHVYSGPKIFEVCTFRSLRDGPTSNTFGTVEEDVQRRDFTLNALFYDPLQEIVVDYVGGMKDIREKRIRPIIPLASIFTDDPVRMIRAVKYGAAVEFKLPLSLRWKIRRQSPLLAGVSPSRLTEELFKIVHSAAAPRIVDALDSLGLYAFLQPRAAALFRERPGFRGRYLRGLEALGRESGPPGSRLAAFIRDFLEEDTDWAAGPEDLYKNAFLAARQFVLPINPPRIELDNAVRLVLGEHGIHVKRSRLFDRPRQRGPLRESGENTEAGEIPAPAKRRRRRRRSPSKPAPEGEA